MSLLSRLWKGVRGVVAPAIGTAIGGPIGGAIGAAIGGSASIGRVAPPAAPMPSYPSIGPGMGLATGYQPAMAILPRAAQLAPSAGRALGYAVGRGIAGARAITRSAMTYCRRHPQWCSTIGGIAAVEALVRDGQLPVTKRRRAKGISGRELQAFRRVSRTLNKWCKVPAPTQRARRKC